MTVHYFDHFILTRFNVRSTTQATPPPDQWLRHRLSLFERFCLPSVEHQTVQRFTWLLFFDSDSPAWLRARIAEICRDSHVSIEAIYVDGVFTHVSAASAVSARTSAPLVLTTRIDNDDCIARDFVETLQDAASGAATPLLLNFVDGCQFSEGRVYTRPYRFNPFISLIESTGISVTTVFARGHHELDGFAPVRDISTTHPMWLQVVHRENIANEVVGFRSRGTTVTGYFPVLVTETSTWELATARLNDALRIGMRLIAKPARLVQLVSVFRTRLDRRRAVRDDRA